MTILKTTALAAASTIALGAAAYAAGLASNEEGRIEVGYLECDLVSEDGNIIVSNQTFLCTFDPAEEGYADEAYVAEIEKIGVDLSATTEETIRWVVFAPADRWADGVLEGGYVGVSADAAIGVGVGGKALVGGSDESIALQPLSVSTHEGFGVALAVEKLTLVQVRS